MLKMAIYSTVRSMKNFAVLTEDGHLPFFFVPTPGNLPSKAKKLPMPGGQPGMRGEGVGPSWVKLTDALITNLDLYCFKKVPQEKCLI